MTEEGEGVGEPRQRGRAHRRAVTALVAGLHPRQLSLGLGTDGVGPHVRCVGLVRRKQPGGVDIAPPGAPDSGANRNASSVIWEWVAPGVRAVVWPPAFATHPVEVLPLAQ